MRDISLLGNWSDWADRNVLVPNPESDSYEIREQTSVTVWWLRDMLNFPIFLADCPNEYSPYQ